MDEISWKAMSFSNNWTLFKSRHPELYQWEYYLAGITVFVKQGAKSKMAGHIVDLGSWHYEMLESHLLNVLRDEEEEYRKKRQMEDQQEKAEQSARKKGEMVGGWLLALNPKLPMNVVNEISKEAAKMFGFRDMDSGMEFVGAVYGKFQNYNAANGSRVLLDNPQTDG